MAIKIEAYGSRQKKTCFGCGSMISFENDDITVTEDNTYIICPVCGKKIKAYKIERDANTSAPKTTKETEIGKKVKEALESTEDWDDVEEKEGE